MSHSGSLCSDVAPRLYHTVDTRIKGAVDRFLNRKAHRLADREVSGPETKGLSSLGEFKEPLTENSADVDCCAKLAPRCT